MASKDHVAIHAIAPAGKPLRGQDVRVTINGLLLHCVKALELKCEGRGKPVEAHLVIPVNSLHLEGVCIPVGGLGTPGNVKLGTEED